MTRGTLLLLVFLGFIFPRGELRAQESIVLAQHDKLPLLGKDITFLPFRPLTEKQNDLPVLRQPGTWQDVRLVAWEPPVATISGRRGNNRGLETAFLYFLSFPEEIRSKLSMLAPLAAAAGRDKKAANTLLLSDGRKLEEVKLLYAVPYLIHVSHSTGEEDIPLWLVEPTYSKHHGLTSDSVYLPRMTLRDGTVLEDVRIVAQDAENTRVMHRGGSMAVKMEELSPEAADLVQKHLVDKNRLATEVLSSQARAQKNRAASAHTVVAAPSATPKPELIRKGPLEYAQIPLSSGEVLRNVKVVGFNSNSILFQKDGGGEASALKTQVPPEVLGDTGDMPYELLEKLLKNGLIARQRSPIFAAVRGTDVTKPFENATGGREIAQVGMGYAAISNRYRNWEGAVVALPKPVGGQAEVYVLARDFAHLGERADRKWWNESETKELPELAADYRLAFKPVIPDSDTVLLDPFEGKYTLFGNERKVMKRAWEVVLPNSRHHAFVETANGFFFGILSSKEKLEEAGMTWTQLVNHQSTPYVISKAGQKAIKTGQAILKLTDIDGSGQAALLEFRPAESQIVASHYRRLTEQGIPGVIAFLHVPQAESIDLPASATKPVDFASRKETLIDRVALEYVNETDSVLLTKLVKYQRERTIEQTGYGDSLRVTKSPWREVKDESLQELPKDADGGVRITDGQKIYEVQPNRISDSQLVVYEVKANPLDKKPR